MINFAASLLLLLAVWRHTTNFYLTQIYVLVGSILFIVVSGYRLILLIFRNLGNYKLGTRGRVMLIPKSSAIWVVVPINRSFKIRPGSFLYLWIPGASFFSGVRTHPYQIAWWQTDHDGRLETVTCLIQNTNTFTRRLAGHFNSNLLVWIDGPYGADLELDKYNQVLLVATGIGIASQLSYLRLLVEKSLPGKLSRDIFVAWEIEHPCKFLTDWNMYINNISPQRIWNMYTSG
jgi:predicted ferric reductase